MTHERRVTLGRPVRGGWVDMRDVQLEARPPPAQRTQSTTGTSRLTHNRRSKRLGHREYLSGRHLPNVDWRLFHVKGTEQIEADWLPRLLRGRTPHGVHAMHAYLSIVFSPIG